MVKCKATCTCMRTYVRIYIEARFTVLHEFIKEFRVPWAAYKQKILKVHKSQ